jgi:hypothetical protein
MYIPFRFCSWVVLAAQGFGCLLWWLALALSPSFRHAFVFPGMPDATFAAFVAPDALLYAGFALVGAWASYVGRDDALTWLKLHAGAAAYAVILTAAFAFVTGGGWIGAALMALPTLVEGLLIAGVWREEHGAAG